MKEDTDVIRAGIGSVNLDWGLCGFVSAFYAVFEDSNSGNYGLIKTHASKHHNVLAEIKTYLRMLQAKQSDLIKEIEEFTKSFGNEYVGCNINNYIQAINLSVNYEQSLIKNDAKKFSLAMPPAAVQDYLRSVWNFEAEMSTFDQVDEKKRGVVGLKETTPKGKLTMYGGLAHWVYTKNGQAYTWGQVCSFDELKKEYTPIIFIETKARLKS